MPSCSGHTVPQDLGILQPSVLVCARGCHVMAGTFLLEAHSPGGRVCFSRVLACCRCRFAYFIRTGDEDKAQGNLYFTIGMTLGVMTIEDIPQLVLNCIYLDSRGFAGADGIAVFSFVMSLLSITSNLVLLWYEQGMVSATDSSKINGNPLAAIFGGLADRQLYTNPMYDNSRC